jgi:hypothetical protein
MHVCLHVYYYYHYHYRRHYKVLSTELIYLKYLLLQNVSTAMDHLPATNCLTTHKMGVYS